MMLTIYEEFIYGILCIPCKIKWWCFYEEIIWKLLSNLPVVISKEVLPGFIVLNYGDSGSAVDFISSVH